LPDSPEPQPQLPQTPDELRDSLASAAASGRSIELFGGNSKRLMAGAVAGADFRISTARMRRILQYEPRDLTTSVEAGMPFADLNAELARNGQMIPLDGAYAETATVGGMVAANISGARRRLYGTARDLVIGMRFATLDGKLVDTGGMVVKNVAGLDMAKLMIGSFGTLAAIASVNFKLTPRPKTSRTLLFSFDDVRSAMEARTAFLRGVLNPVAVELLNPILSAQFTSQFGTKGFTLALLFAGNEAVMERSVREAATTGPHRLLSLEDEQLFWAAMSAITPRFLEKFADGAVVRVSTTLSSCAEAMESVEVAGHAHAASGIVRGWFSRSEVASRWLATAQQKGWKAVVEFSSGSARRTLPLWPGASSQAGGDFGIMKGVKQMFDPGNLLNRGRLYGQL
jgi:glycolate oxidase FAD binding subunit